MARSAYQLKVYAQTPIESMNGTTYTLNVWTTISTSPKNWTISSEGAVISYETDSQDDKNSPILSSKITVPFLVDDLDTQNALNAFRTSEPEKSVWITLRIGTSGSFIWCGYVIQDLEDREDTSFPYVTTLTAIDGLATLKEVPFIRETNSSTGATPTFPYVRQDTWDNAGYKTLIGSSSSWLVRLLDYVGQVLASDDVSGELTNYTIQTSFNWWNEDMSGTPAAGTDPLALMQVNMRPFYSEGQNGKYNVPNVYDVLRMVCVNFNMRLLYWNHTFYFIQIGEYKADEQGSEPYTSPINIPTREYFYNGGTKADNNFIGDPTFGIYKMKYENATNPSKGLQKLSGGSYQGLPAIKKTIVTYEEKAGGNAFNGFPLFVTHNTGSITPTTWGTSLFPQEYKQISNFGGIYQSMIFTDAKDLDGFVCKIYCDFTNSTDSDLVMEVLWSMRAKPVDSAWGDGDNKSLFRVQTANYAYLQWQAYEFPLSNNQQYVYDQVTIPSTGTGTGTTTVLLFDSTQSQTTTSGGNTGKIPIHSDMSGEWEFQFFTFSEYDSDATYPMRASTETANYSHGRVVSIVNGSATNSDGSATGLEQVPTSYVLNYEDSEDITLNPPFKSEFKPVMSGATDFGIDGKELQVTQDTRDTFVYDVGMISFGDGTGANTFSSIKVYNGSNWIFTNANGKWAVGVYSWNSGTSQFDYSTLTYNKTLIKVLSEAILYQQSKSILRMTGTSALSVNDKYYSGSTKLKFNNPIAKILDTNDDEYIFMTGSFNILRDEFQGNYIAQFYNVPTSVASGQQDVYIKDRDLIGSGFQV